MVIKGGSRGGARNLAKHLLRADTNESVTVLDLRHVAAENLTGALLDMEAVALGTKARRALYHASINTAGDEPLTPEQWSIAVDCLEAALGFSGHARALVMHWKAGRGHLHVVWSRIDLERMRAVHDGHNYRIHETVARELERTFGLARVQGAHAERAGIERPARRPSPVEMQQAARTGIDLVDVKRTVTALWREAANGEAFVDALGNAGFALAAGDKRHLVILDRAGGVHGLARRIDGASAAEVGRRLAGIDPVRLATVAEARARLALERIGPQAASAPEIAAPVQEAQHDNAVTPQPTEGPPVLAASPSDSDARGGEGVRLARSNSDVRQRHAASTVRTGGGFLRHMARAVASWIEAWSWMFRATDPPLERTKPRKIELEEKPLSTVAKPTVRRSPGAVLLTMLRTRQGGRKSVPFKLDLTLVGRTRIPTAKSANLQP